MNSPVNNTADTQVGFLVTCDREKAKHFYLETLGLAFDYEDEFALVLRCGSNPVRISEMQNFQPQPFTVLGWEVTDIEDRVRALVSLGVELIRYPGLEQDELGLWQAPGSNARICWFHDPDQNLLSLSECS